MLLLPVSKKTKKNLEKEITYLKAIREVLYVFESCFKHDGKDARTLTRQLLFLQLL